MVAGICSNFYLSLPAYMGHVMNTKVVPNLMIYLLIKFQPYPTCVAKDMNQIPPLCFLKKMEFQRGGN